jgi:hypothetical protein
MVGDEAPVCQGGTDIEPIPKELRHGVHLPHCRSPRVVPSGTVRELGSPQPWGNEEIPHDWVPREVGETSHSEGRPDPTQG